LVVHPEALVRSKMDKTRLAGCNATREAQLLQWFSQPWLTVSEASGVFRVDPLTVRAIIRRGELSVGRLGRVFRVSAVALKELSRRGEEDR
jgi:excisionase family DNA binding protein